MKPDSAVNLAALAALCGTAGVAGFINARRRNERDRARLREALEELQQDTDDEMVKESFDRDAFCERYFMKKEASLGTFVMDVGGRAARSVGNFFSKHFNAGKDLASWGDNTINRATRMRNIEVRKANRAAAKAAKGEAAVAENAGTQAAGNAVENAGAQAATNAGTQAAGNAVENAGAQATTNAVQAAPAAEIGTTVKPTPTQMANSSRSTYRRTYRPGSAVRRPRASVAPTPTPPTLQELARNSSYNYTGPNISSGPLPSNFTY